MKIRKIRLTDSPIQGPGDPAPRWPMGWQVSCRLHDVMYLGTVLTWTGAINYAEWHWIRHHGYFRCVTS